ncbi:MAG: patatin-like phospholipase family protein, partial [Bacteroidota bacterium]
FFFKFFHEYSHKDLQDVLMWEAARSSTAGPTFFEPYKVKVNDEIGYRVLIDGGVFANNPAMCAYSEARRRYADNEFLVVSLGTGRIKVPYRYEEIKDLRLFMWPYRITDIMMNGMNDIVDYQMQQMMNLNENYFRFQAEMGRVRDDWDNAKPEHVNMLQSKAADMVAHYSDELDTLVTLLKGKHVLPPPDTKGKVQPSDK